MNFSEQKTTNANKASEKRKHDEVSDFEEIGISALDNLDDYDSADDSDYLVCFKIIHK